MMLKSFKPQAERRAIAQYFCCDNALLFLIKPEKLIKISILIFIQVIPIQKMYETNLKSEDDLELFEQL